MTNQQDNTKNKILIAMMILPLIAIGLTVPSVNAFDFPFVDDNDHDTVLDVDDNCPSIANGPLEDNQANADGDELGDACDPDDTDPCNPDDTVPACDTDGDGIPDGDDNCQFTSNLGQEDTDGDGMGDACDTLINAVGDIKPGSFPNSVNCDNKGVEKGKSVTPIELFFGQGLVPSTVNLESLEISYEGGEAPTTLIEKHGKIHLEDLTDDDMDNPNGVIHVITKDLCAELEDLLNGEVEVTISGTQGNPNPEAWEFKDTVCLVKQVGGGEGVECEGADDAEEESEEKVTICHKNKKTISVSADSAAEHIAEHGDREGPCNGNGGPPGQDKVTQEANKAAAKNLKESAKGELVPGEKLCQKILKIHDKIHDKVPTAHDLAVLDDLHANVVTCTV